MEPPLTINDRLEIDFRYSVQGQRAKDSQVGLQLVLRTANELGVNLANGPLFQAQQCFFCFFWISIGGREPCLCYLWLANALLQRWVLRPPFVKPNHPSLRTFPILVHAITLSEHGLIEMQSLHALPAGEVPCLCIEV